MITSVETGKTFDKIQYPFIMKEKKNSQQTMSRRERLQSD